MKSLKVMALALVAGLFVCVPKSWAVYDPVTYCAGSKGYAQVQTYSNGNLTADLNGCITFDQSLDVSGRDGDALGRAGFILKGPAIPWGTAAPLQQSSATPTCTYTSTALACINKMGANETSLTLAGMTTGTYYTMIFMQDGTGARTLVQSAVTGSPGLAANTKSANAYDVWLIKATSASAASFVRSYPNMTLKNIFKEQFASLGTAIAPLAIQAQPTVVVPGLSLFDSCSCVTSGAVDATWSQDYLQQCKVFTNGAVCTIQNPNATVTTTPAAQNINVYINTY